MMEDSSEDPIIKLTAERDKYKESLAKLTGFLKPMKARSDNARQRILNHELATLYRRT